MNTETTATHKRMYKVTGMDCAEEIAILKRELGPLAGGEDKLSFDLLNGRMIIEMERPVSDDEVVKVVTHSASFYAPITTCHFQGHSKRPPKWGIHV